MSMQNTIATYYASKLASYGTTAQGVDWRDQLSQELRFQQLLRHWQIDKIETLNDFGCGYGALLSYLRTKGAHCHYIGLDCAKEMIAAALDYNEADTNSRFIGGDRFSQPAEYTVASGVFNVRVGYDNDRWLEYMLETLRHLNEVSNRGFSFNALTSYADADRKRSDLYYADPCLLFDFCRKNFSKSVALLHDYPLFEFTLIINK